MSLERNLVSHVRHVLPNNAVVLRCFVLQVNFLPLDIRDEEDIALVLHHADYIVQYGEDLEPKQPKDDVSTTDHRCVRSFSM